MLLGSDDMIYPKFIKPGDTIGVCAPSNGITRKEKENALNLAIKKFEDLGYSVLETKHVRCNEDYASTDAKTRALELASLYQNDEVKAIILATGG